MEREKKQTFWRRVEIGCYLFVLALTVVVLLSFLWEREWPFGRDGYQADPEVLGGFGDFLAGSVGTAIALVSMYLLFRTLRSQVAATHTNAVQMENQRFNELFFHLLSLYREIMKDLSCRRKNLTFSNEVFASYEMNTDYYGVHFFELWKRMKVQSVPINRDFLTIRMEVLGNYRWFYAEHRNSLGAYYRIIYRILDLIENSEIQEEEKVSYSKILRAQLSESELLMMYYNSLSDNRRKLGGYLWKYNILKHLPALEIRELSKYATGLNHKEQLELDRMYRIMMRLFKHSLEEVKEGGYNILWNWMMLSAVSDKSTEDKTSRIRVSIFNNLVKNYSDEYPTLTAWSTKKWKEWLDDAGAAVDYMVSGRLEISLAAA